MGRSIPLALVYLDTNIVSAIAKNDLHPWEMDALLQILEKSKTGRLKLTTSEVTRSEIERLQGRNRPPVQMVYNLLEDVAYIDDHKVLGFHSQWDGQGDLPPEFFHSL